MVGVNVLKHFKYTHNTFIYGTRIFFGFYTQFLFARKLRPLPFDNKPILGEPYLDKNGHNVTTLAGQTTINGAVYGQPECNKSLRPIYGNNRRLVTNSGDVVADTPPAYMNTAGSEASDPVKYYVLEDANKCK